MIDAVFWIPARNKEAAIEMSLRSALLQTLPCRIVVSDQGSTDLTREVIFSVLKDYKGHHTIELRNCDAVKNKGHTGFNDHINWFHKNVKYDVCVCCSADDFSHPDRMEKVVKAFEEHDPSMVLTKQTFCDPVEDRKLVVIGESCYPNESRFLNGTEIIKELVGGSSSIAWSREFMEEIGELQVSNLMDCYMPFLASQSKKGCYYVNEAVHSYVRWSSADNMGAMGILTALDDEAEKGKVTEVCNYQLTNSYIQTALKSEELYPNGAEKDRQTCYEEIVKHAIAWANQRNELTIHRIQPKGATI